MTRSFISGDGSVWWLGGAPVRLQPEAVEALLKIFDGEGADDVYAELFNARSAAMADRIPILEPITVQVRQLDPAIWGDTLTAAEAA